MMTGCDAGELCKEGGGSSSKYAVDCSGMAGDRVQLTQVLWPDHCVANTSSSLFNSELNVLPTDLIIQEGEHCHASISVSGNLLFGVLV